MPWVLQVRRGLSTSVLRVPIWLPCRGHARRTPSLHQHGMASAERTSSWNGHMPVRNTPESAGAWRGFPRPPQFPLPVASHAFASERASRRGAADHPHHAARGRPAVLPRPPFFLFSSPSLPFDPSGSAARPPAARQKAWGPGTTRRRRTAEPYVRASPSPRSRPAQSCVLPVTTVPKHTGPGPGSSAICCPAGAVTGSRHGGLASPSVLGDGSWMMWMMIGC